MSMTSEQIRLYSRDYSEVLLSADSRDVARQFLRDSGEEWLPVVIDFGNAAWKQRWSGRMALDVDGVISEASDSEYLRHLTLWSNPFADDYPPIATTRHDLCPDTLR